ncbi:MBL fold metallo-hydrolase [Urbifossiella limnaea]|uniref:Metallo-hydrolase YycJ n=1 Tax=Urbifossiella limnaea TaxID=2528023 RepID=A0A517XVM5_9BACT|nr:MBL fold metallo-hydrolase [Urbifossiella limnaea]QDU21565.1 Putative metallo-hydrolase YycJ [Urbifossiella limnaea]
MTARFTVLASGSSGNAALLEVDGFGLLIDCGLHSRFISARLAAVGRSWEHVHAAVLTHTHGDHWKDTCLADFRSRKISLHAHPMHLNHLATTAPSFGPLKAAGYTRAYADGEQFGIAPGLTATPVWVSHDSEPTFAFRFDYADADGLSWSVGYASDLGVASAELVAAFAGVDVLAVEYNHCERMERASTRPAFLVQRVLGDQGHLSNRQAAEFTRAVAARSGPGFPSHLVQLHLSRDCNHPFLAEAAGRNALADLNPSAVVLTARQDAPAKSIDLVRRPDAAVRLAARPGAPPAAPFPTRPKPAASVLPGFGVV